MRPVAAALALTFVGVFAGCTTSGPEIIELFWQINQRMDVEAGTVSEELAFFVHARDADGDDDFASVYLLHDGSELFWHLQADSWERPDITDETWIGHSGLTMNGVESFPRGSYRVVLADLAGQRTERSLFISADKGALDPDNFPTLTIADKTITVSSRFQRNTFRFYDGGDNIVTVLSTTATAFPIEGVLSASERERVTEVTVYAYDDALGVGLVTGPYRISSPEE